MRSRDPIYVSVEVWRALMRVAKEHSPEIGVQRARIADEIADSMLREAIQQKHPAVFAAAKMDAELIKTSLK